MLFLLLFLSLDGRGCPNGTGEGDIKPAGKDRRLEPVG
jgi:hypothetical protein